MQSEGDVRTTKLENSPHRSTLSELFSPTAVVVELLGRAGREVLTAQELQFIGHCAEKRIQDFSAGRACAHHALAEMGINDFSLLAGTHREPLWPTSIVGSITHTKGFAAAVIARAEDSAGIGIDCEVVTSVTEDLWSRICTPEDLSHLERFQEPMRSRQAALMFAAKEAFYKCQFPMTRQWVGFEDVSIEVLHPGAESGRFRLIPRTSLPWGVRQMDALLCRFQYRDDWVIAGVTASARVVT